jgi:surface antigen
MFAARKSLAILTAAAILGLVLGGSIGHSMDKADQGCVGQAMEHAKENQSIAWDNPDTQEHYTVTPVRTFQTNEGRYCREYQAQATVGGKVQETYGTACRQPDGAWQSIN